MRTTEHCQYLAEDGATSLATSDRFTSAFHHFATIAPYSLQQQQYPLGRQSHCFPRIGFIKHEGMALRSMLLGSLDSLFLKTTCTSTEMDMTDPGL